MNATDDDPSAQYLYIDPDDTFRLTLVKYLKLYLDYMNREVNDFTHVQPERYVESSLSGFMVYLAQLPTKSKKEQS